MPGTFLKLLSGFDLLQRLIAERRQRRPHARRARRRRRLDFAGRYSQFFRIGFNLLEIRGQHDGFARHGYCRRNDRRLDGNVFNNSLNDGRGLGVVLDRRRLFHSRLGHLVRRSRRRLVWNLRLARLYRFGF